MKGLLIGIWYASFSIKYFTVGVLDVYMVEEIYIMVLEVLVYFFQLYFFPWFVSFIVIVREMRLSMNKPLLRNYMRENYCAITDTLLF